MKRLSAILLSVLFLLTMLPMGGLAVHADQEVVVYLEEGVYSEVTASSSYAACMRFTPSESGYYLFETSYSYSASGTIYHNNGVVAQSNNSPLKMACYMDAGETYEVWMFTFQYQSTRFSARIKKFTGKIMVDADFQDTMVLASELTYIPQYVEITYSDGTTNTSGYSYLSDAVSHYYADKTCDIPVEQWTVGNSYTVRAEIEINNQLIEDEYVVTVVDTPIASVEVEPVYLIENYNGYWDTDSVWNESTGQYETSEEYFYYRNIFPDYSNVVITLKDGTVAEMEKTEEGNHYFRWYGNSYGMEFPYQSYDNRLLLGDNERPFTLAGYEGTYTINVEETPVVGLEYSDTLFIENDDGYWRSSTVWDAELQEYVEKQYFRYSTYPSSYSSRDFTITLKDGTVIHDDEFEWNGVTYRMSGGATQDVNNHLTLGENEATISIAGFSTTYTITIIDSPVASVEIEPIRVIENNDGYWNTDSIWNASTGQYETSEEYFYYYDITPGYSNSATITLKDGTVIQGNSFEWNGKQYSISTDSQRYESRLQFGMNERPFTLAGYEGTYTVEVIDTPVASVEMPSVTLIENCGGYWTTGWVWDEEQGDYVEPEYYYYNSRTPSYDDIVITLKDGTVINDGEFYWNGNWYGINYESQDYESRLLPGENERPFTIAGYEGTYTVTVNESPVSEITTNVVNCKQYTTGKWTTGWIYDEEVGGYGSVPYFRYNIIPSSLTFALKDGTTKTVSVVESEDWDHDYDVIFNGQRYELDIQNPQYADNAWDIGTYTVAGNVLGVDFTYQVVVGPRDTDAIFDYVDADGGVIITDCWVPAETIEIPSTIDGKTVIGVADLGDNSWVIKNLIFPDSVTLIGEYVLTYNLKTVHFGAGVNNLSVGMFNNCYFSEITVSPQNPNYTMVDGGLHDKAVTTLIAHTSFGVYTVPDTVYDIGVLAKEIYDSVELIIPEGHTHVTKVDGITYDKDMTRVMFCDRDKTGEYVMPDSVTEVATYAFYRSQLTNVVVSPKVTELVYCVFASCASLESVTLPEGLVSINQQVFRNTDSLKVVELPDTLTRISYEAFDYAGLTTLYLPKSVTEILDYAFYGCWDLSDVYYTGSEEDRAAIEMGYNRYLEDAIWHYNTCTKNTHIYDNDCDNTCNNCDWIRTGSPGHSYVDGCDPDCDSCGFPRTPPHEYDGPCDADCGSCDVTREPPHEYDGPYDADCNQCGLTRDVPEFQYGDGNGDGNINIKDLGLLQQYLNGWDVEINTSAVDVNGDGSVNIKDLGLLQQYLNGWDVTLGR